jgi:hypothetical protein
VTDKSLAPTGDYQIGQVIDRGALPVAEVVSRVRRIQEVMKAVMHEGTHYGVIPGTPKPTLYQPGAEALCMTFRIAANPRVEDLSTEDAIRYRVTMGAVSQVTGEALGEGVGECSSNETKYRWQRPVCDEEFDETPDDLKREKWMRGKNGATYKAKQIRTSPADIANTILKMAYKRALISMTRTVLACSDQFAQDLEDLPEEIRENVVGDETQTKPPIQPPQRKAATQAPVKPSVVDGEAFERPSKPPAVIVSKVEPRKYQKDGKERLFYTIHFSDGRMGSTFSESVAKLAAELGNDQTPCEAVITPGRKEGTFNLAELSRVTA